MKNKLGFTLIELFAMITILAVISLISFSFISNMLDTSKKQSYERYLNDLYIIAENYIEQNRKLYPELDYVGGTIFINVNDFIKQNFMSKITKNPKTDQYEENATIIATTNNNYIIEYRYIPYDMTLNGYSNSGLMLHYDGYFKPINNNWKNHTSVENDALVNNSGYVWNIDNIGSNVSPKAILTENNLNMTDQMTFSMLFKLNSGSSPQILFSYRTAMNSNFMIFNSSKDILIDTGIRNTIVTNIEYNKIYKLDVVIDSLNIKTYIDGKLVNTATGTRTLTSMPSNLKLSIFGETTSQGGANYYVDGNLYNVKVYGRILTDAEINSNYNIDKARFKIGG